MKLSEVNNGSSSHLAVLWAIPQLITVSNVLELGYGNLSTRMFLDKNVYPNLEKIDSYENNFTYAENVGIKDDRLNLHVALNNMSSIVENIDLSGYNLCLVDDSTTVEERCDTIRVITNRCPDNLLIVIHDFEHHQYNNACNSMLEEGRIDAILPHTGILWHKNNSFWDYDKFLNLKESINDLEPKPNT